jgi:hypothetical protein
VLMRCWCGVGGPDLPGSLHRPKECGTKKCAVTKTVRQQETVR